MPAGSRLRLNRRWAVAAALGFAVAVAHKAEASASSKARISAYNRDVDEWMEEGGGLSEMESAFPDDTLKIVISKPGPTVVKPSAVMLTANYTTMDLHELNPALKYYNGSLWYEGTLPMWDEVWSNNSNVYFNGGRDEFYTLIPYDATGAPMQPLTLPAYKCNEYTQEVLCDALPSPPPPTNLGGHPARGSRRHLFTAAAPGAKGTATSTDASPVVSEQASSSDLINVSAAYPPPKSSGKTCLGYFREIQFLSTITLLTTLSGTNSSWTFTTGQCSMEWVSATMPVSQQVYNQDMNAANDKQMAWCYSWPMHFRAPNFEPTIYVRSSQDPYILAAELTGCTYDFDYKPPKPKINKVDVLTPLVILFVSTVGLGLFCYFYTSKPKVDYTHLLKDGAGPGYGAAGAKAGGGTGIEFTETNKRHVS